MSDAKAAAQNPMRELRIEKLVISQSRVPLARCEVGTVLCRDGG